MERKEEIRMVKTVYRYTLNAKKKKKAVGILVQSLTEPDAFTSKSLKGSIVYKVS